MNVEQKLAKMLWRLYSRPESITPWQNGGNLPLGNGGNLPWDEPAFSKRMLNEHLSQAHGAASRVSAELDLQMAWLWQRLGLAAGGKLYDVTCGPGLYAVDSAERGLEVLGVDFSPASIEYARKLAEVEAVGDRCTFVQADIRTYQPPQNHFDAAILLYGQLAVMSPTEAQAVLTAIAGALKAGGRLCLEMLNPAKIDKTDSTWWFTDDTGLWGDAPFLHLGARSWDEEARVSTERYHIIHLETGKMDEIVLCDQAYSAETLANMLANAGFSHITHYPAWDGLPLYDADEWIVTLCTKL